MGRLTMMIGLPRSGKSTRVEKIKRDEVIVSADELRYLVYGQRYFKGGEALMWSIRKILLEYLMKQDIDIIIDETNITKDIRKNTIDLAKKYNYQVDGIYMETKKEECIKRAKESNQEDLIPIIEQMSEKIEFIEPNEEGFNGVAVFNDDNVIIRCGMPWNI